MESSTIEVISSILTFSIAIYLVWLKSYLDTKAKNLAQKSDVGEITHIVEETKKQFTNDLEILRNNLGLYKENYNSIRVLERNAIIEINTKYSAWLNSLLNFNLVNYSLDYYQPLIEQPFFFQEKHLEFNIAEDNLSLYIHDGEIMNKLRDLKHETYDFHKSVLINLSDFLTNCEVYSKIKAIAPIDKFVPLNTEYLQKQEPIIDKSIADMVHFHSKIINHQIDFIKILNYRIYQIIGEK